MKSIKIVIVGICIICNLFILVSCGNTKAIYGTWEGRVPVTVIGIDSVPFDVETTVIFNFYSDGTGDYKLQTPDSIDISKNDSVPSTFTYELTDDTVLLLFSLQETERYVYEIRDKSLKLTGEGKEYNLFLKE